MNAKAETRFANVTLSDVAERQAIFKKGLAKFTPWQNWQETASIGKSRQVSASTGKNRQEPARMGNKGNQEPGKAEDWKIGILEEWKAGRMLPSRERPWRPGTT